MTSYFQPQNLQRYAMMNQRGWVSTALSSPVSVKSSLQHESNGSVLAGSTQTERIRRDFLRQAIQSTLHIAKELPPDLCLQEVKTRLILIQDYCHRVGKTFIFVEEVISCQQYELGGSDWDKAVLFRGPSEDASVAICVTQQGSLLHRNSSPWMVYRNMGDINP